MRLMQSDVREPLNIGSDEMVSMQEMARMICAFDNKPLGFTYTPGPMGVRYTTHAHSDTRHELPHTLTIQPPRPPRTEDGTATTT